MSWRTLTAPASTLVDALCLLIELWADRCSIGLVAGVLDVCPRYEMTPEQDQRLARYRGSLPALVPWAVPTYRSATGTFVAWEAAYPTAFITGGN